MLATRARSAFTLAEVIISLVVGAIVILIVSALGVGQERFAIGMSDVLATSVTVREAAAILAGDLRAIDPAEGDIPAGEARDTSIQFRTTVATAVVCDTIGGALVLAPSVLGVTAFGSTLSAPQANDTLGLLVADTTERWEWHVVTAVGSTAGGPCAASAPVLTGAALLTRRPTIRVSPALATQTVIGMPIRITRPLRYSLYKSSDGSWSLGQRDWNSATQRLNTIQPLSGPLLPPGPLAGMTLAYADSNGNQIPIGSANTRGIALVRLIIRSPTAHVVQIPGMNTGANGLRLDSAIAIVGFRNRQ